jgi:hypothetical protein
VVPLGIVFYLKSFRANICRWIKKIGGSVSLGFFLLTEHNWMGVGVGGGGVGW